MKKKIALVSSSYYGQSRGGAELQLFLLANHLQGAGYRTYHVFIDNGQPIRDKRLVELRRIRKKKHLRRIFGRYFFLDYFKLQRTLKSIDPEFIIVRGGFAYVGIAAKYCSDHRCRMAWQIASEEDVRPFRPRLTRALMFNYLDKKFLEYGLRNSAYVIAQAKYQDDLLWDNYHRRCDVIIPNSQPLPIRSFEKKDPVKVIWIANFKELKRPEVFIKLASEFKNARDAEFIMIGRDSRSRVLKDIRSQIAQAGNIDYRGELPLDEVNEILSHSHILVNTSTVEGFPNTFIQAWMRGVPVVSLDVDPDHLLEKLKIGFHSGSFEQMVKDIQVLISDRTLREEMGERAREFACEHYSPDNLDLIVDLIEKRNVFSSRLLT